MNSKSKVFTCLHFILVSTLVFAEGSAKAPFIYRDQVVQDPDTGEQISCLEEEAVLSAMMSDDQEAYLPSMMGRANLGPEHAENPSLAGLEHTIKDNQNRLADPEFSCPANVREKYQEREDALQELMDEYYRLCSDKYGCPQKVDTSSCLMDVAKNAAASAFPPLGLIEGMPKTGCTQEFVRGVLLDLWHNVDGLMQLPGMAKKGVVAAGRGMKKTAGRAVRAAGGGLRQAKHSVDFLWNDFWGKDNSYTAELLLESHSDFIENSKALVPDFGAMGKKVSDTAKALIAAIEEGIGSTFGCEAWDTQPFTGKCIRPMTPNCATCNQRINAICGTLGYLGGEIAAAFLTGGASAVVGAIAKGAIVAVKGSAAVAKVSNAASKSRAIMASVNAIKKSGQVMAAGARKTTGAALAPFKNTYNSFKKTQLAGFLSRQGHSIKKFDQEVADLVKKRAGIGPGEANRATPPPLPGAKPRGLASSALRSSLVTIAAVPKVAQLGVTSYFKAMENAFRAGMSAGGRCGNGARSLLYHERVLDEGANVLPKGSDKQH
ncbi:hypothetical protein GW916_09455 [bacterium]|nr:hypothetical protein [bacterium]